MGGPGSGRKPGGGRGKVKVPNVLKYFKPPRGSAADKRIKREIKAQKMGEKRLWGNR